MKILVAEDDRISRLIVTTSLTDLGHDVLGAEDGVAAWNIFVKEHPHLVITDWMMPEMDGLDLCRRIRKYPRDKYAYVMMLTALTGKRNFLGCMEAGADDFLTKPVDMDELAARLVVAERMLALQTEVKQLQGLLSICAYCKRIKDDNDEWHPVESYIKARTEAKFSHGVCPDCYQRVLKPELDEVITRKTHECKACTDPGVQSGS